LHQTKYAKSMFQKFNKIDCKPTNVCLVKGFKLVVETSIDLVGENQYCQMVKSLLNYCVIRFDIQFEINIVSRFMSSSHQTHLDVVKCIMCYINDTLDYGILCERGTLPQVIGYMNVDWAFDFNIIRWIGSYLFMTIIYYYSTKF